MTVYDGPLPACDHSRYEASNRNIKAMLDFIWPAYIWKATGKHC